MGFVGYAKKPGKIFTDAAQGTKDVWDHTVGVKGIAGIATGKQTLKGMATGLWDTVDNTALGAGLAVGGAIIAAPYIAGAATASGLTGAAGSVAGAAKAGWAAAGGLQGIGTFAMKNAGAIGKVAGGLSQALGGGGGASGGGGGGVYGGGAGAYTAAQAGYTAPEYQQLADFQGLGDPSQMEAFTGTGAQLGYDATQGAQLSNQVTSNQMDLAKFQSDQAKESLDPTSKTNLGMLKGAKQQAADTATAGSMAAMRMSAATGGGSNIARQQAQTDLKRATAQASTNYLNTMGQSRSQGLQGLAQAQAGFAGAGQTDATSQQRQMQAAQMQSQMNQQMNLANLSNQQQASQFNASAQNQFAMTDQSQQQQHAQFGQQQANMFNMQNAANQMANNQFNASAQNTAQAHAFEAANMQQAGNAATQQSSGQGWGAAISGGLQLANSIFSDYNLKENVKKVGNLKNGLGLYSFNYKGDSPYNNHIGLMAQEVEKVNPNAVSHVGGYKAVNYSKAVKEA